MKEFVAHSVLSKLSSQSEHHPAAEVSKIAYETELKCETLMKRVRTFGNKTFGIRKKDTEDCFFEERSYCCVAAQRHQGDLESFNSMKTEQMIDLCNEIFRYDGFRERDMLILGTANFEDICVPVFSKRERSSLHVKQTFLRSPEGSLET